MTSEGLNYTLNPAAALSGGRKGLLRRAGASRIVQFALIFLVSFISVADVIACEAPVDTHDNRISIQRDGSFKNANIADVANVAAVAGGGTDNPFAGIGQLDAASGNAVLDRANGRVAQRVFFSTYGCRGTEALLFVDCGTRETILVFGELSPAEKRGEGIAGYFWPKIENIQPPHGPISVTGASTVDSIAKAARRHNILYLLDAEQVFSGVRKRDRYDALLGCKLFYPSSPGAKG